MAENQPRRQSRDDDASTAAPAEVTQTPQDADAGVSAQQVPRTADRPKDEVEQDAMMARGVQAVEDIKLGALKEPEHANDKTSYPGPETVITSERPPFSTSRPDVPIVQSALLGANEHIPPDPEVFDEMGRPRDAGERN